MRRLNGKLQRATKIDCEKLVRKINVQKFRRSREKVKKPVVVLYGAENTNCGNMECMDKWKTETMSDEEQQKYRPSQTWASLMLPVAFLTLLLSKLS